MRRYLRRYGPPAFTLAIIVVVGVALYQELKRYDWRAVRASLDALSGWRLWVAIALALCSYMAASVNDWLGVRYAGRKLSWKTTIPIGFICYAVSYNVGFTALGGTAMRYQLYASRGLTAAEIAKVVVFECSSFFVGLAALAGILLVSGLGGFAEAMRIPAHYERVVGGVLLLLLAGYFAASWCGVGSIGLRGWRLAMPAPPLVAGQMLGSIFDISLAAGAMFILLPEIGVGYWQFLPLFLVAMLTGLASTVPGGLGVIEAVMLTLLRGRGEDAAILGGLLAYRVVYYLIPLGLALLVLVSNALHRRRREVAGLIAASLDRAPALIPRSLASTVYLAGVFLLISGLLPPHAGHVRWLDGFFPLAVIEVAYVLCAALGVLLLFFSRGIQRGLMRAHRWTIGALGFGVVCALLRGLDYTAALVLALPLLPLLMAGGAFTRDKPLFSQSFRGQWFATTAVSLAVVTLVALIVLAQQGPVPLDGTGGLHALRLAGMLTTMGITTLGMSLLRAMVGRKFHARPLQGERAIEAAAAIDPKAAATLPKHTWLIVGANGDAAIAFVTSKGRWTTLGGPMGNPAEFPELVWSFTDAAELAGCNPVARGVPADMRGPFLRAGYIPITPHPGDHPADGMPSPCESDAGFMTRSLGMEIRAMLHAEHRRLNQG